MVFSDIFGEEPEAEPPPPPPPPPGRFKSAVTSVKDNIAYQKKKRATKKLFKGLGAGDGSEAESRKGSYQHDQYEVLPTKDKTPQTSETHQPQDIDYWKTTTGYNHNNDTNQAKSATFASSMPADQTNTYRSQAPGTIGRSNTVQWEALESRPGNVENRTLRSVRYETMREAQTPVGTTGAATMPARSATAPRAATTESKTPTPRASGVRYADKISLQTNKIHCKARTKEEQLRERQKEFEERDKREQLRRGREKTIAEEVISAAARCSHAIVGLFYRIKITLCYACGLCDNTANHG